MLTLPQNLLDGLRRSDTKVAALVGIVIDFLSDEQSSQADWEAGLQLGTPGVDFPATTFAANLTAGGTTATVSSTAGFTVGSNANPGFLAFTDGANIEIVSYTASTNTTFTGLQRGLYGTTAIGWSTGEFVLQLLISSGEAPEFDLEIQPKNWIQPAATGAPAARTGSKIVYRPTDGCIYMFGGWDGAVYLQDLWKFDLSTDTWTNITPGANPPIRAFHHMVYNPQQDEIWMCGGISGAGTKNDLWKYSFTTGLWTTNVLWNMPAAKWAGAAAYYEDDAGNDLMIVAGGVSSVGTDTATTAIFGGIGWAPLPNAGFLWARGDACWMQKEGGILVTAITTVNFASGFFNISTNTWSHAPQVTNPPATRYYPTLEYDDVNNNALLFGGSPDDQVATSNFYSFNRQTNQWTTLDDYSREGRTRHAAAWNSDDKELVIWGGAVNSTTPTWPAFPDPIRYRYYWAQAIFQTQVMDMTTTPTETGNWELEDITDIFNQLTAVSYDTEWSNDGIAFTPIGTVLDGDEITDLHQYYRVVATMINLGLNDTPHVQIIDANFDDIAWFSMSPHELKNWCKVADFPPIVKSVSNLNSRVELQKFRAESGTIRFDLINTSKQAERPITVYFPRSNTVFFKLGLFEDGFPITDFFLVNKARIEDWSMEDDTIHFTTGDFLADLTKKEIPEEDSGGAITPLQYNNVGITSNPVEIIRDILQNQINIPDRDIDLPSFDVVQDDPLLAGWAFNRLISSPESAWNLIMQICYHIQAFIIPRENGKLAIKKIDPNDPADAVWDERTYNFRNVKFLARAQTIRNFISTWWNWNGAGDDFSSFFGAEVQTDGPSVTRNGTKVLRHKSKWLGSLAPPYNGDDRAIDISTRMLAILREGLPAITLETNLAAYPVQVGDIVRVQSSVVQSIDEYRAWAMRYNRSRDLNFVTKTGRYSIPYRANGVIEAIDMKWFPTRKQVDFAKGVIQWELTRARQLPLQQVFTTQDDFLQGFGSQIDMEASPGSVVIALNGGPYFATGTYELVVDMDQQPERDGYWTLTDTTPADSTVTYEAWASETGHFMGEEMPIGAVIDTDDITLKTRYYKIKATLTAATGLAQTPSIDAITITFDDG